MDLTSSPKKLTDPWRSEVPHTFSDEPSLADTVHGTFSASPSLADTVHGTFSASPSLADTVVPETRFEEELVPETPKTPNYKVSDEEYKAWEKEYEERINWNSKRPFCWVKYQSFNKVVPETPESPRDDDTRRTGSGASIVAKVTRDRAMRNWVLDESAENMHRNFGSGYPGDPETKAWLEHHKHSVFGFPSLVRFSWGTCTPFFNGGVEVLWESDEQNEDGSSGRTGKRQLKLSSVGFTGMTRKSEEIESSGGCIAAVVIMAGSCCSGCIYRNNSSSAAALRIGGIGLTAIYTFTCTSCVATSMSTRGMRKLFVVYDSFIS